MTPRSGATRPPASFLLPAAAVLAGCGSGHAADAAVVRDSAGIEIVENVAPVYAHAPWTISAEPEVTIGLLEGDPRYQLFRVSDASRLSDGRIVIANSGTSELRYYDAAGRFLKAVGGEGGGPGEFGQMGQFGRLDGDSVAVWDFSHQRLSVFGPDGGFARSVRPELSEGSFPAAVEIGSGGRFVVATASFFGPGAGAASPRRDPTTWLLFDAVGRLEDTLSVEPGFELIEQRSENAVRLQQRPFGRNTYVAVSDSGTFIGDNGAWEIRFFDRAGALRRIIRMDHTPRAVTSSDRDAFVERRVEHLDPEDRPARERELRALPFAETFPAFAELGVDALGYLWVRRYGAPGASVRWDVFDARGRYLLALEPPPGVTIQEAGRDYLIGLSRDDLDVEHVVVYALDRGAERP